MFFWGTAFVSGRMLTQQYHPFCVAYGRFFLASLILFPILYKKKSDRILLSKNKFLQMLLLGLTGVFAYNFLFFSGLKLVEAGRSSIIISVNPVITTCAAVIIFKEQFTFKKLIGVLLAFLGLLIVLTHGHLSHLLSGEFGRGELYLLGAVFSWVTYTLIGKHAMKTITPFEAATWASIIGSFMILPFALKSGLLEMIPKLNLIDFLNFLNLGIFSTCFGFIWYYDGVKEIGAARASSFINLIPIIGISVGVIFLHETVSLSTFFGGFLVILGIALVNNAKLANLYRRGL